MLLIKATEIQSRSCGYVQLKKKDFMPIFLKQISSAMHFFEIAANNYFISCVNLLIIRLHDIIEAS